MLTIVEYERNEKIFKKANSDYNIFTKELEEFLGEDFYISPATSSLSMFGCYPGGLVRHLITVCKYAVKVNEILPESLKQPVKSIMRIVFLSQIGKVFMFNLNTSPSPNKPYDFNDDIVRMQVGERSIYYALKYGVELTEEECQAILNIGKGDDDKQAKYFSAPLTQVIKTGFELAIMEEKNEQRKG